MGFNLFEKELASAEGETIVKTYHCSKLSPALALFGLRVNGYVVVTNRRLVYYAEGSSGFGATGNNRLYNEVPLAEVTNISMSQGTRFSLLRLIGGLFSAMIIIQSVTAVLGLIWGQLGHENPYFLRAFIFVQLAVAAYLVARVSRIERESFARILLSACTLGLIAWGGQVPSLPGLSPNGVFMALGRAMRPEIIPPAYSWVLLCLALLSGGYFLWCLYWFVRRQYFLMGVVSKSSQYPSITIAGYSVFGRQILNVSGSMASNLSPSIDAEALFKELGAVIADIQATGDLGIQKWKQLESSPRTELLHQSDDEIAAQRKQTLALSASVLTVAVLIVAESIWYADMSAKRQAALQALAEASQSRKAIGSLSTAEQFVPKHFAAAEGENRVGQELFEKREFVAAKTHWLSATTNYQIIPPLVKPLERAEGLQQAFNRVIREACDGEYMTALDSKMDQYSQLEWSQIKVFTNKADGLRLNELGEESCSEWTKTSELLPSALKKLKVGIWMEQAEQDYKNKNWLKVIAFTDKVLKETPNNTRAAQLRDKSKEARNGN